METKSHRYDIMGKTYEVSYRIFNIKEDNSEKMYFHESDVAGILAPIFDNDVKIISILGIRGDVKINNDKYYNECFRGCLSSLVDLYKNDHNTAIIIRVGTSWDYNNDDDHFKDADEFYLHLLRVINAIESVGFRNIQAINNFDNSLAFIYRNETGIPVIMDAIKNETISTEIITKIDEWLKSFNKKKD